MGILDTVFNILQKPQGVALGAIAGAGNTLGRWVNPGAQEDEVELSKIFKELDDLGADTSQFEHLRPKAQTIWGGIKEGWNNEISPSSLMAQSGDASEWHKGPSGLESVVGTVGNVTMDPLMVAGATGAGAKLAAKTGIPALQSAAQGANAFGKVERGTDLASRLGTYGRRGVQGTMLTGNPLTGAAVAPLIGAGEIGGQALAKVAGARLAGLTGRGGAKALGNSAGELPAPSEELLSTAIEEIPESRLIRTKPAPSYPENQLFDDGTYRVSRADVSNAGAAEPTDIDKLLNEPLSRSLLSAQGDLANGPLALPAAGKTSQGLGPATPMPQMAPSSYEELARQAFAKGAIGPDTTQRFDTIARQMTESGRAKGKFLTADERRVLEFLQKNPQELGRVVRGTDPVQQLLEILRRSSNSGTTR